jgi:hypothetical protein
MDVFLELMRTRKRNNGLIPKLLGKCNIFRCGLAVSSNGRLMKPLKRDNRRRFICKENIWQPKQ